MNQDLASQLSTQVANLATLMTTIIAMIAVVIGFVIGNAVLAYLNRLASKLLGIKMDGNTALTATTLVSSGNLPKAAPCIPAVAKALSDTTTGCESSIAYANTATSVAHERMTKENIPMQSQTLLGEIKELKLMMETLFAKEERHNTNNAAQAKLLQQEIERLKGNMDAIKANNQVPREQVRGEAGDRIG